MRGPRAFAPMVESPRSSGKLPRKNNAACVRYYNEAVLALDQIYEAAMDGDPGAQEVICNQAGRLLLRGGLWRDLKHRIEGEQG